MSDLRLVEVPSCGHLFSCNSYVHFKIKPIFRPETTYGIILDTNLKINFGGTKIHKNLIVAS